MGEQGMTDNECAERRRVMDKDRPSRVYSDWVAEITLGARREAAEKMRKAFVSRAPCRCAHPRVHEGDCVAVLVGRLSEGINTDEVLGLKGGE